MTERPEPNLDYAGAASASRIGPLPAGFATTSTRPVHDPSGTRYEFADLEAPNASLAAAWPGGELVGLTLFLPLGADQAAPVARAYAARLGMADSALAFEGVTHPHEGTLVTLRAPWRGDWRPGGEI